MKRVSVLLEVCVEAKKTKSGISIKLGNFYGMLRRRPKKEDICFEKL